MCKKSTNSIIKTNKRSLYKYINCTLVRFPLRQAHLKFKCIKRCWLIKLSGYYCIVILKWSHRSIVWCLFFLFNSPLVETLSNLITFLMHSKPNVFDYPFTSHIDINLCWEFFFYYSFWFYKFTFAIWWTTKFNLARLLVFFYGLANVEESWKKKCFFHRSLKPPINKFKLPFFFYLMKTAMGITKMKKKRTIFTVLINNDKNSRKLRWLCNC